MRKKSILWILLDLVFLIVFNVVFFVAGGTGHSASVWLAYGFIHLAYLMVVLTPFLIRKSRSAAVFGFSIHSISSAYFLAEFAVGVIFILLKLESIKVPLIVQVVLAGAYAAILLSHLIANESTADSLKRQERETDFIKSSASRVKVLIGKGGDKKTDKLIEKAYDALHASPTRSSEAVRPLEKQITDSIAALENAVKAQESRQIKDCSEKIISLTDERNRLLRVANR